MEADRCVGRGLVAPRSILHSIAPVGVGTAFAESAESYLRRLAESHGVERSQLHQFINLREAAIYGDLRGQAAQVDAPTQNAAAFMRRVAELTTQPNVSLLGLGWLAGHVTTQQCLRKRRAWCGACLSEMLAEGRPVCAPLLWSFSHSVRCSVHETLLTELCPVCRKPSPVVRERIGRVGLCDSCGAWLGCLRGAAISEQQMPIRDTAITSQLGTMVACAQHLDVTYRRPRFSELVADLHRNGHAVSASELSRRLGVSKGTICDLMKGRSEPGLDLMLRLATSLSIALVETVLGIPRPINCVQLQTALGERVAWALRPKPRKDWGQIQMTLEFETRSPDPMSVPELARRVGVDAKHFSTTLPTETSVLRQAHLRSKTLSRQAEVHDLIRRLIRVGDANPLSKRAAARAIGIGRTRRPFKEAICR